MNILDVLILIIIVAVCAFIGTLIGEKIVILIESQKTVTRHKTTFYYDDPDSDWEERNDDK